MSPSLKDSLNFAPQTICLHRGSVFPWDYRVAILDCSTQQNAFRSLQQETLTNSWFWSLLVSHFSGKISHLVAHCKLKNLGSLLRRNGYCSLFSAYESRVVQKRPLQCWKQTVAVNMFPELSCNDIFIISSFDSTWFKISAFVCYSNVFLEVI